METTLREYIILCIEIMVAAVLIGIITVFSYFSNTAYKDYRYSKEVTNILEEYKNLHPYDNKIIKGVDVIDTIASMSREYGFKIILNETSEPIIISSSQEFVYDEHGNKNGSKIWTLDYLNSLIGESIKDNFKSSIQYNKADTDGTLRNWMIFTVEGA